VIRKQEGGQEKKASKDERLEEKEKQVVGKMVMLSGLKSGGDPFKLAGRHA